MKRDDYTPLTFVRNVKARGLKTAIRTDLKRTALDISNFCKSLRPPIIFRSSSLETAYGYPEAYKNRQTVGIISSKPDPRERGSVKVLQGYLATRRDKA